MTLAFFNARAFLLLMDIQNTSSDFEIDGQMMTELAREAPVLMQMKAFADSLDQINWFAHLGERPTRLVKEAAAAYASQLGFPDAHLAILPTWEDAADVAETHDWSSPAWEAEELARADLTAHALEIMSEEALEVGLRYVAQKVAEVVKEAMEDQAAMWDVADEGARNLAVGAAAQAAHGAALLLAAFQDEDEDAQDHPFSWKLRLFAAGRWPVAVVGGSFNVF